MKTATTQSKLLISFAAIWTIIAFTYSPMLDYLLYSRWVGPDFPMIRLVLLNIVTLLFVVPILTAVTSAIVAVCKRQHRNFALSLLLACIPIPIAVFASSLPLVLIQQTMLNNVVDSSKPLVSAISDYSRKTGKPPKSLTALIPEYLKVIPSTGMGAFPNYEYNVATAGDHQSMPWMLRVNFSDEFSKSYLGYRPKELSSKLTEGQVFEGWRLLSNDQIQDWCFVKWVKAN